MKESVEGKERWKEIRKKEGKSGAISAERKGKKNKYELHKKGKATGRKRGQTFF